MLVKPSSVDRYVSLTELEDKVLSPSLEHLWRTSRESEQGLLIADGIDSTVICLGPRCATTQVLAILEIC